MNMKEIRDFLVEYTGRYDLQSNTTMAAFFINAGIKMLDDRVKAPTTASRHLIPMAIGMFIVYVQELKTIEDIAWRATADKTLTYLERIREKILVERYGKAIPAYETGMLPYDSYVTASTGSPALYSLVPIAASPMQVGIEKEQTNPGAGIKYGETDNTVGIMIYPAPDTAGTLQITGYFDRSHITGDFESNWWMKVYPELVVEAAAYKIEVSTRNTEGANDRLRALEIALHDVENSMIDLEIGNKIEMEI